MEEFRERPADVDTGAELKALIAEASRALIRLDSVRLEEIALSCQALNQGLESLDGRGKRDLARQARDAALDMAVFARVLDATRGNLRVMKRLRELRIDHIEYTERQARGGVGAEAGRGDH